MRARRERLRLLLLGATGLVALAVGVLALAAHALRPLELETVDTRFSIRGTEKPNPRVALVGIDETTRDALNIRGAPLDRRLHARVIDRLRRAGARVIAYDIEFTEPTSVAADNALILAVRRAGNVVLGTSRVKAGGEVDVFGGGPGLTFSRAAVGVTTYPARTARGGTVRRIPYAERGVPSFPVAAARRAGIRVGPGPFAGDGAWIDFAGPPGTYETIPFVDVLRGRVPASRLRDRVVVVGATAPVLQDIQSTATGAGMPGPELQANSIATILDGFPLDEPPGSVAVLLIALLGIAAPAAAAPLRGLRWLPVPLLAGALYAVVAQFAFDGGTILPVTYPLLALAVGLVGTLGAQYATELRERRRLRVQFARFVPEAVVDEVVERAEGEDLRLGGQRREGTVLFCDLRGFTRAAETLPAEQVIELLNRYLTEMSEAILGHGGTVVSYMGDGIMAVFGAPLEQADHRERAVASAREMAGRRLAAFNAWVRDAGVGDPFRMGIGICSGPVMSGNVGSERRLEYAAVGDTTNMASRLETMTKEGPHSVLVAESTAKWLSAEGAEGLRYVGELPVRGRAATVRAWTLDADGAGPKAGPVGRAEESSA